MPRTRHELEQAAAETEKWLESLDPAPDDWDDPADLRAIGEALRAVADGESALAQAVKAARSNGRSWSEVAMVLGVSRQAARERYGTPTTTTAAKS